MYIYISVYIYTYTYMYIYIYITSIDSKTVEGLSRPLDDQVNSHKVKIIAGIYGCSSPDICYGQWEFQDPKMEVLYHTRPYFVGISPYIGLI